jgi:hypothetical protein
MRIQIYTIQYTFKIFREEHQHESFVPMPSFDTFFLLLKQHHGGAKCCSMLSQNVSGATQCSLKIWREVLTKGF